MLPSPLGSPTVGKACLPNRKAYCGIMVRPHVRSQSQRRSRHSGAQSRPVSRSIVGNASDTVGIGMPLVRPYSSPATRKNDTTSAASQNRLKGIIGRRYLSEALEPQFVDPLDKCKCRFALCTVQEIFGDQAGLAKQMLLTIKELRPLLHMPEAQDLFVECVEKLTKSHPMPLEEQCDLLAEAIRVAQGPRLAWLTNEHRRCKGRIRKIKQYEKHRAIWTVAASYIVPFLSNPKSVSCVNRLLRDAARALRCDKPRERRKCNVRIEPTFEPKCVEYPDCQCGLAMVVRWQDSKLAFVCRQGMRGCQSVIQTSDWRSEQQESGPKVSKLQLKDGAMKPRITIETVDDEFDFYAKPDETLQESARQFLTDPSIVQKRLLRPSSCPVGSVSSRKMARKPAPSMDLPGSALGSPSRTRATKKFQGDVFKHFLDSQNRNGGKKFTRIPKRMLMEEYMMKNQLTKLAHYSIRTRLETQDSMDKTYDNQLFSSLMKNKAKPSADAVVELKAMVNSMLVTEEQEAIKRFARENLGGILNMAKVDRRTTVEIEREELERAQDDRKKHKDAAIAERKRAQKCVAEALVKSIAVQDDHSPDGNTAGETNRPLDFVSEFFLGGKEERIAASRDPLTEIEEEDGTDENVDVRHVVFVTDAKTLEEVASDE